MEKKDTGTAGNEDTLIDGTIKNIEREMDHGMGLLQSGDFDTAITYFRERQDTKHPRAFYGLATALFDKKGVSLTEDETKEVIDLYQKAIDADPTYADAFLMSGMAHEQLTGILFREFKKYVTKTDEALVDRDRVLSEIDTIQNTLDTGKEFVEKALELNPAFDSAVDKELLAYDKRKGQLEMYRREFSGQTSH